MKRSKFSTCTGRAFAFTAIAVVCLAQTAVAQNAPAGTNPVYFRGTYQSSDTDKRTYDKHDFNGLWSRNPGQFKMPACPECRDHAVVPGYGFHGVPPPRTPLGEKRLLESKPGRGFELGKDAAAHPDLDIGMKRARPPANGNDPEGKCDPLGLARNITFSGGGASMEMVQVKDRIIQRFEWTWDNREIWMDGRKIPNVDDYLPRYNGYSTAKWEGDTLVVTSTGFDDRQWLDQYGYPMSDKAVLEERWQRISPNRLQVQLTLIDPLTYTKPWVGDPKIWALIPPESMSISGWSGLLEDRCIPTDESLFNKFRDHAAGK